MITGEQIRGARAMLRWSAKDLADASGLGTATIQRMESTPGVPKSLATNLEFIQRTLEDAGIIFIEEEKYGAGPGGRLRTPIR